MTKDDLQNLKKEYNSSYCFFVMGSHYHEKNILKCVPLIWRYSKRFYNIRIDAKPSNFKYPDFDVFLIKNNVDYFVGNIANGYKERIMSMVNKNNPENLTISYSLEKDNRIKVYLEVKQ